MGQDGRGFGGRRTPDLRLTDAIGVWLDEHANEWNLKPRTVAEYDRAARRLDAELGHRELATIGRRDMAHFFGNVPSGCLPSVFSAISAMVRWLERERYWPGGSMLLPRRRPHLRPRTRHLSDLEYRRVWQALHDPAVLKRTRLVVRAALRFAVVCPLRRSEIVSLAWSEVDFDSRILRLYDTKTGDRSLPLTPMAAAILEGLPRRSRYVFTGRTHAHLDGGALSRAWRRIVERAGIDDELTPAHERVTLHTLRHSWASRAIREGVSLEIVRRVLGHSDRTMSIKYAHVLAHELTPACDAVEQAIVGGPVQLHLALTAE